MDHGLCLVSGIYPPDSGGPAKFTFDFEHYARERVSHLDVVATTIDKSSKFHFENGTIFRITRRSNVLIRYLKFISRLRKLRRKNHFFLVTGAFLEFYFSGVRKRSQVVYKLPGDIVWERARNQGLTNLSIEDFQSLALPFKFRLMRKLYTSSISSADKVIVPSFGLKKLTEQWGIDQSKVYVIFNSVDIESFQLREQLSKEFDVLTVCRLTKWKGVEELLRTTHNLGLSLAIVGDGPERVPLEELGLQLKARVHFFGDVSFETVRDLYSKSKRFVLNSTYEGLPHVLLEARASNLLCLAREGTGSSEVIHHMKDGILYGGNSGLDLEEALLLSFSKKIDEDVLKNHALIDLVSRFSQEINFQRILGLIYEK